MRHPAAALPLGIVLLAGCSTSGEPAADPDAGFTADGGSGQTDAGSDGSDHPTVLVTADTPILVPDQDGCLVQSDVMALAGEELEVLAADDNLVLIDESGSCLQRSDVEGPSQPLQPDGPTGTIQWETPRFVYGEDGCPVATEELLETGADVLALARSHDASYRGYSVVDRRLGLAPVRLVDGADWTYPWHASVQLVKEVPQGFVIGGGVIIGPNAILTADHLGADTSWCYSREPVAGPAWEAGLFVCDNIASSVRHPGKVDARVLLLESPVAGPHASVRQADLAVGEAFYANRFSTLRRNAFADSTVEGVGSSNAFCDSWPAASSFTSADLIVGGGDSGGPAFVGDDVVGLVHGERCKNSWEDPQHVFVHLPGIHDFLAPYTQ